MTRHTIPPEFADRSFALQAAQRRQALTAAGCATYTIGQRQGRPGIVCLCCGLGSSHPRDIERRYCGFCKAYHRDWDQPAPAKGETEISAISGYGHTTQAAYVELVIAAANYATQMSPAKAREVAQMLLESADAADSDAYIVGFVRDRLGITDPNVAAQMLLDFRRYRDDQRMGAENGD